MAFLLVRGEVALCALHLNNKSLYMGDRYPRGGKSPGKNESHTKSADSFIKLEEIALITPAIFLKSDFLDLTK
jgi:hypothetical protein